MRIDELKGAVNLINLQLKQLDPLFDFLHEISMGGNENISVMSYITDVIEKQYIKKLVQNFESQIVEKVSHDDLNEKLSIFTKKDEVKMVLKSIQFLEGRADKSVNEAKRLDIELTSAFDDIKQIKKEMMKMQPSDEFLMFK